VCCGCANDSKIVDNFDEYQKQRKNSEKQRAIPLLFPHAVLRNPKVSAENAAMKYQRVPMPPANLEQTVARYNSFVESGVDADFDKPTPRHRIEKPPFYAAWATPVVHDTRAGLRINAVCQVIDMNGEVIPGLYCGGEAAGGFSQHGLARAACQGYIAGRAAAPVPRS
jgi:succinate dehydrogenase/fumarate reductase flavoprotein subunit